MHKELKKSLEELKLLEVKKYLDECSYLAIKEGLSFEEYLSELLSIELDSRHNRKVDRFLRESRISPNKTFSNFDRTRLSRKLNSQINVILEGDFLDKSENILIFGNSGVGKTHIAEALGTELIHKGHKILFKTCNLFVQELLIAKKELRLSKYFKKLSKYRGIILDDIGYVQQDREEIETLFMFFAESYEKNSLIITSNLAFSEWDKIFKDPVTTSAAIDRLIHHSIILEMNLPSYRLESAKKRKKEKNYDN